MAGEKIELTFIVNNDDAVRDIKQTQNAYQDLSKSVVDGNKKQKKSVDDLEKELKDLKKAWKETNDPNELARYNKSIKDTENQIRQYGQTGEAANQKIEKSGSKLMGAAKSWALGFATLTAAVTVFKKVVESTDKLSDKFARTLNGWKEGFNAIARAVANSDFKKFGENIRMAIAEATLC